MVSDIDDVDSDTLTSILGDFLAFLLEGWQHDRVDRDVGVRSCCLALDDGSWVDADYSLDLL